MRLRMLIGPAVALAALALSSCDGDAGSPAGDDAQSSDGETSATAPSPGETDATSPPTGAEPVQFREVAHRAGTPCVEPVRGSSATPAPAACGLRDVDCTAPPATLDPDKPVGLCDLASDQQRYLLEPAAIVGGVQSAEYGIPQNQVDYAVTFALGDPQAAQFARISARLASSGDLLAIVVDGQVVSAPSFTTAIDNGKAQISGEFTAEEARKLAETMLSGG